MTKRLDPDLKAIFGATRALRGSSSLRMLRANMEYLIDRFLRNPPRDELQMFIERGARLSQGEP